LCTPTGLHISGKTCASELQDYADKAPLSQEVFLSQLSGVKFELPAKWDDVTTERPPEHHRCRGHEFENIEVVDQGDVGDVEEENVELVQVIRQPPRGDRAGRTLSVIAAETRIVATAVEARFEAAAEVRSDEPVEAGSFVFISLVPEDRVGGFMQPFALALVTEVQLITPRQEDAVEEGSVDHADTLLVQYLTASAYDKQYLPAVMTDNDAAAAGVQKNSIHSGKVRRGQVAVANVITNKNKVGKGKDISFQRADPYPVVFPGGQVAARFSLRLDGKTTINSLKTHAGAHFEQHSKQRRQPPAPSTTRTTTVPAVPAVPVVPVVNTRTRAPRSRARSEEDEFVPEGGEEEEGGGEEQELTVRRKSRRLRSSISNVI
jgi:hypothetical protein